jgi:hypothetical protein
MEPACFEATDLPDFLLKLQRVLSRLLPDAAHL